MGVRAQWQKNVSTKLGILFQELVNVTAMVERAEKLAASASAASQQREHQTDSRKVHQDLALKQTNQIRALEQQVGNALHERGRALKELQTALHSEIEARGHLQQKVDWLLKSQDKVEAYNNESLSIVAGKIDNKMQIEIDKNRSMLEQTHQHLGAQLEIQRGTNAAEFLKIGQTFAALKEQIAAEISQIRTQVGHVQPASPPKPSR